jgi:GNAT superfamily N-acetyltransferase
MRRMLVIRPYTDGDLAACRGLWAELTQHHRELYQDPSIGGEHPEMGFDDYRGRPDLAGTWVACREGRVAGMTGLLMNGDEGQIEPVIVTAELRGQGIGEALILHARNEAVAREARFLSLMPVARNTRAIQKFIALGFDTVGLIDLVQDLRPGERAWLPRFDPGAELRY